MNDFGLLVGRYFSTLPTLSDTQLSELQLDSLGRLIISGRYLEDSAHVSGDAGIFSMGVRDDGVQASAILGGNTFTAVTYGTVGNAISLIFDGIADVSTVVAAWNAANPSNQVSFSGSGATVPSAQTVNLSGGANESVSTSNNGDYSAFAVDKYGRMKIAADVSIDPSAAEFNEDSPNTSGDVGLHVLTVRQDTLATSTSATGDYADLKVNALGELYVHDTDVKAELVAANTSLDNIEAYLLSQQHAEDSAHVSGDKGAFALAVQHNAETSMVSADGDYAPLQVNSIGRLKVDAITTIMPVGSEQYSVTDALAAGGDGLVTITASATPWITVASYSHTSGTAYIYGMQWACDQNADARLVSNDGVDTIVYKRTLNSSSSPTWAEHWNDGGRIEIAGSAGLEIRLQIKKRSATGGNANGTGSIHLRV